jgi:hypothetical protein
MRQRVALSGQPAVMPVHKVIVPPAKAASAEKPAKIPALRRKR